MKIFALSDPHLSFQVKKPMSVFGAVWDDHAEMIRTRWQATVGDRDVVIIGGDLSWGMRLDEAIEDLRFMAALPGKKVLVRGNHDYWWSTVGKMEARLKDARIESLSFLRYEAMPLIPGVWLAGSRGWLHESESDDWAKDAPVYRRELIRFDMALNDAKRKMGPDDDLIAVSHFSPLDRFGRRTPISDRIAAAGVTLCVHGHVHTTARRSQEADGVTYLNTAADVIDFTPALLHDGTRLVYNG